MGERRERRHSFWERREEREREREREKEERRREARSVMKVLVRNFSVRGMDASLARQAFVTRSRCVRRPRLRLTSVPSFVPSFVSGSGSRRVRVRAGQEQEVDMKPEFSRSNPLKNENGDFDNWTPSMPGVYAVYDESQDLQYIGLSRKISASIEAHSKSVLDKMSAAQVLPMPGASKESLQTVWKSWIESYVEETGDVPAGNQRGEQTWLLRKSAPAKEDIKLTPGKGSEDLLVPIENLIDSLVKSKKVVSFIKGTRTAPECGFSHQVLTLLNGTNADYETVNVLDEHYNPGLRAAIKIYSDWPTIPQVYVNGEFVGGADIIIELSEKGELKDALK